MHKTAKKDSDKHVHYICPGECNGVSEEPGVCQAESFCSCFGKPLVACDCEDDTHHGKVENEDANKSI